MIQCSTGSRQVRLRRVASQIWIKGEGCVRKIIQHKMVSAVSQQRVSGN